MNNILEIKNLKKIYSEGAIEVEAVKGISLAILPGEIISIMGPSGSGKTTLLSMMGCILKPTSGDVSIGNKAITNWIGNELSKIRLKYIGFIFQTFNLFSNLNVRENVEVALNLRGIFGREAKEKSTKILEAVGLSDRINFLPRDLSGGQKQRISIARAIVNKPPIVLADEPTGNLDSKTGRIITELLKNLAKKEKTSVVIVTHDNRILDIVDKVYYLEDGVIKI
jgi:putative ABC transport system ATP-binding protein